MNKGAVNAILLSVFGTALVTTLVFPNRPTSLAIKTFFVALSNGIRAMLGTKNTTPSGIAANIPNSLIDKLNEMKKD